MKETSHQKEFFSYNIEKSRKEGMKGWDVIIGKITTECTVIILHNCGVEGCVLVQI